MPFINAYADRQEAEVMQDTWGHLAPEPGQTYSGYILFTLGCYGDLSVIRCDFGDLPDSPWFHEDLHRWIWDQNPEEGTTYRFNGTYSVDATPRFVGELRVIDLDTA